MINSYKELLVLQKAVNLTIDVYTITKLSPKEELFCLTSQMRRAAIAIPSNVAEGYNRGHRKEYIQHIRISFSSAAELETQCIIANKINYIYDAEFYLLNNLINEISRMLRSIFEKLGKVSKP